MFNLIQQFENVRFAFRIVIRTCNFMFVLEFYIECVFVHDFGVLNRNVIIDTKSYIAIFILFYRLIRQLSFCQILGLIQYLSPCQ